MKVATRACSQADTLTGNHLLRTRPLKERFRQATGSLPIVHATVNNLKNVSVNIPTGCPDGGDWRGRFGQEFAD